jgi:uncharacterized membrane protein YcaP (DUF421 family)
MSIVIRTLVIYVYLYLLLRSLGKRELGELNAFELLLLVVLGDLIQQGVTGEDESLTGAILAVSTIALVILVTSYLSFRSRPVRSVIEGVPSIVVRNGRFVDDVIRIERITHDEILDAARRHGIRDLADVDIAILEPGGDFSFLPDGPTAPPAGGSDAAV